MLVALACAVALGQGVGSSGVPMTLHPVPLNHVRLLSSPVRTQQERNLAYLREVDPDRLLARYRENAGLPKVAEPYTGWESSTLAGTALGHYLSAVALAYAATGEPLFRERARHIVAELALCQAQHPHGFVGGYPTPEKLHEELRARKVESKGFDLNGYWVPWYNLHKLFGGLLDAHSWCEDSVALDVAVRLAEFMGWVTENLDDDEWQRMLACEHGGLNESFAEIHARTGEHAPLELAERFYHRSVLDPLAAREAKLPGLHGNTQIPKVIGTARLYELTSNERYRTISEFFFDQVLSDHTYALGGNTDGEHFHPVGTLSDHLTDVTAETCNTYNMLKLTERLLAWTGDARYADYYERATLNHILGSQNSSGGKTYFVPMAMGANKTYSEPWDHWTCCHASGMESHAKFGTAFFGSSKDALWLLQYLPSELLPTSGFAGRLTGGPLTFEPAVFEFTEAPAGESDLKLRWPAWSKTLVVLVNGSAVTLTGQPGSFVTLRRAWNSGDSLEVRFEYALRAEPIAGNPQRVAMFYGPVLLAADVSNLGPRVPVFVPGELPQERWLRQDGSRALAFLSDGATRPEALEFRPFHTFEDERYTVYLDRFSPAEWAEREAIYRQEEAARQALDARTVDWFEPGNMQHERDHSFDGERSSAGFALGRRWRHALDGGWFEWTMKLADEPVELWLTFWGSDSGGREFEILIDGLVVRELRLEQNRPGEFFDEIIPIDPAGRDEVRVRLQAKPGKIAGGIFGARVVRARED